MRFALISFRKEILLNPRLKLPNSGTFLRKLQARRCSAAALRGTQKAGDGSWEQSCTRSNPAAGARSSYTRIPPQNLEPSSPGTPPQTPPGRCHPSGFKVPFPHHRLRTQLLQRLVRSTDWAKTFWSGVKRQWNLNCFRGRNELK